MTSTSRPAHLFEVEVVVEPTVQPLDAKAATRRGSLLKRSLPKLLWPLKFALTVVVFLAVLVYMLPVMLLQGLGMLAMMYTMPKIMVFVYPSPLGKIHVMVLWVWRKISLGEEGHSRSVRVDLSAHEPSDRAHGGAPDSRMQDSVAAEPPPTLPYAVHTVACLLDNYAYIVVDLSGRPPHSVALVDPCESSAVIRALERLSQEEYGGAELRPVAILCTHHHWDHAWGNKKLLKAFPGMRVYGGALDRVSCCTHRLRDGDTLRVGSLPVTSLSVPCHTRGSMLFCIAGPEPAVFGGDTLFCGGCGAPFEGTQDEMSRNFAKMWRCCPGNTLLFPGHEYSLAILPQYVSGGMPMPETPATFAKLCTMIWRAHHLRARVSPVPTVPLLLDDELALNSNFAPLRRAAAHLAQAWRQHEALSGRGGGGSPGLGPSSSSNRPPPPSAVAPQPLPPAVDRPLSQPLNPPHLSPPPSPPPEGAPATSPPPPAPSGSALGAGASPAAAGGATQVQPFEIQAPPLGGASRGGGGGGGGGGGSSAISHMFPGGSLGGSLGGSMGRPTGGAMTDGMVMVPAAALHELSRLLMHADSGTCTPGAHAGALPMARRLASELRHRHLPSAHGHERAPLAGTLRGGFGAPPSSSQSELVTQVETQQAFELLEAVPGQLHQHTLRRALMCTALVDAPLSPQQVAGLLQQVIVDERGLVALERFNQRLSVLPPMAEPRERPGACARCCAYLRGGKKERLAGGHYSPEVLDTESES